MAVDVLGRVVEAASGKRLSVFMDERLFQPLKMVDTGFWLPAAKMPRLAQPQAVDPASGQKISVLDVSAEPANDSGGAGALSTAMDYLRFGQMLLNGGELDGVRVMSRSTIKLMTSDHLGTRIAAPMQPGELLLGTQGYTFGLGFAVRQGDGIAGVPGSAGEFMCGICRHLFLGRSQGRDRGRLLDPGAEPDPRVLSQDVQDAGLSVSGGLTPLPCPRGASRVRGQGCFVELLDTTIERLGLPSRCLYLAALMKWSNEVDAAYGP